MGITRTTGITPKVFIFISHQRSFSSLGSTSQLPIREAGVKGKIESSTLIMPIGATKSTKDLLMTD